MDGSINVVHVDDEPDFADLSATFLERVDDRFDVTTASSVSAGNERLTLDVDCVVSDYDLQRTNGIEFLEMVRKRYPDLPFILFTGKGSEEIASEAMSAGVTDYIQKETGTDQYQVLANRIRNAVEKYRTERELERKNDLFKKTQEIADIGAWEHDLERDTLMWTEKVYEMHGVSTDFEPTVESLREFYHPDDYERGLEAIDAAINDGEPFDIQHRMIDEDGDTRWFRSRADPQVENGEVVRVRGTIRDITERRERKRELQENSNLLDQLIKQVPIHMYIKDEDGRHLRVSEHHADDREEYLGKTDREVFPAEFGEQTYTEDMRVIETEEPILKVEEYLEGEDEWHLTSKVPWYDDDGEVAGLIGVTWEISDQKAFERELTRQNDRLKEFGSLVSHELRNPLNVARGELGLVGTDGNDEHLERAASALDRMEELIEDLLTLAREGENVREPEEVNLRELIDACWQHVETPAATLVVETSRTVGADPSRLRQLFGNLFRNADEHADGPVTITVGDLEGGFYVEDDGPGIPEDVREQVFEAGYSTGHDGTGFGLSIVEEIVDAHGWEISLTESDAGGARFEITGVTSSDDG